MAIETQPERAQGSGGGQPVGTRSPRPWWQRPAIHTALAGAVVGYLVGHLLGNFLAGAGNAQYPNLALSDSSDWPIVLGYVLAIVGWLAGEVLQVRARSQGGRHPVPGWHDHLLLHGGSARDGDQDRVAVPDPPRL